MRFVRKIEKSLATRGILGSIASVPKFVADAFHRHFPDRLEVEHQAAEIAFDKKHGVDTAGYIPLSDLDVQGKLWMKCNAYQGVSVDTDFAQVLGPLEFADYSFVDLGCGKGRAVMLASRLPFRQVIGVEFSDTLLRIAEANRAQWREAVAPITLHRGDASEYELPAGALVVFIYNSFGAELMTKVAERVAMHPGPVIVLYFTPKHAEVWDARLTRSGAGPGFIAWRR